MLCVPRLSRAWICTCLPQHHLLLSPFSIWTRQPTRCWCWVHYSSFCARFTHIFLPLLPSFSWRLRSRNNILPVFMVVARSTLSRMALGEMLLFWLSIDVVCARIVEMERVWNWMEFTWRRNWTTHSIRTLRLESEWGIRKWIAIRFWKRTQVHATHTQIDARMPDTICHGCFDVHTIYGFICRKWFGAEIWDPTLRFIAFNQSPSQTWFTPSTFSLPKFNHSPVSASTTRFPSTILMSFSIFSAVIDGVDTSSMSREQLEKFAQNLRNEVEREREERNFFQLERDKLRTFWEITKNQLGLYFCRNNNNNRIGPLANTGVAHYHFWDLIAIVRLHAQVYHFHVNSHSNRIEKSHK